MSYTDSFSDDAQSEHLCVTQLAMALKIIFILAAIEIWVKKFFKNSFSLFDPLNFHDPSP